jgi:hypothetical protein
LAWSRFRVVLPVWDRTLRSLLACLDSTLRVIGGAPAIATGEVARHRHREFMRFLKQVAKAYPDSEMHLVMDNYATLSHPAVKAWLARNPRSAMHFTPTFGCRLNLGRGLVRSIERQTIRCDTPRCVKQVNDRISALIDRRTDDGAQLFRLNHDRRSVPRQSRLRPDHRSHNTSRRNQTAQS